MNLIQGLITGALALVLPLVPSVAEAPEPQTVDSSARFHPVGDKGFSFRWVDEETSVAEGLECSLYEWCAYADIVGPACPNELLISLDYLDDEDLYVTSGTVILPAANRQRHSRAELGTSQLDNFETFVIDDIRCYQGLPTGVAEG